MPLRTVVSGSVSAEASGKPEVAEALDAVARAGRILDAASRDSDDLEQVLANIRAAMATLEKAETILTGDSPRAPHGKGARNKILSYFLAQGIDVPITGTELKRISGIQEWARRVRELRVEGGWDIRYEGNAYLLKSKTPNKEVARAWRLANAMRSKDIGTKERILRYLQASVGKVVNSSLLQYVSGTKEPSSLIRQLRMESGYPISTHVDRPGLERGCYVLENSEPILGSAERHASETLRQTVFERDRYTCVVCNKELGYEDRPVAHYLLLGTDSDSDSESDPESFVTLCSEDDASMSEEDRQHLQGRRRRRVGG